MTPDCRLKKRCDGICKPLAADEAVFTDAVTAEKAGITSDKHQNGDRRTAAAVVKAAVAAMTPPPPPPPF